MKSLATRFIYSVTEPAPGSTRLLPAGHAREIPSLSPLTPGAGRAGDHFGGTPCPPHKTLADNPQPQLAPGEQSREALNSLLMVHTHCGFNEGRPGCPQPDSWPPAFQPHSLCGRPVLRLLCQQRGAAAHCETLQGLGAAAPGEQGSDTGGWKPEVGGADRAPVPTASESCSIDLPWGAPAGAEPWAQCSRHGGVAGRCIWVAAVTGSSGVHRECGTLSPAHARRPVGGVGEASSPEGRHQGSKPRGLSCMGAWRPSTRGQWDARHAIAPTCPTAAWAWSCEQSDQLGTGGWPPAKRLSRGSSL